MPSPFLQVSWWQQAGLWTEVQHNLLLSLSPGGLLLGCLWAEPRWALAPVSFLNTLSHIG